MYGKDERRRYKLLENRPEDALVPLVETVEDCEDSRTVLNEDLKTVT